MAVHSLHYRQYNRQYTINRGQEKSKTEAQSLAERDMTAVTVCDFDCMNCLKRDECNFDESEIEYYDRRISVRPDRETRQ